MLVFQPIISVFVAIGEIVEQELLDTLAEVEIVIGASVKESGDGKVGRGAGSHRGCMRGVEMLRERCSCKSESAVRVMGRC